MNTIPKSVGYAFHEVFNNVLTTTPRLIIANAIITRKKVTDAVPYVF